MQSEILKILVLFLLFQNEGDKPDEKGDNNSDEDSA